MAQQYLSVMFIVLTFAAGARSQLPPRPVVFIPTLYVTDSPERPNPDTAVMYVATVCSPKTYQGFMSIARINIPSGWKPFIGVMAMLEVCSTAACDNVLCTNYPGGVFNGQHNCTFTYNSTVGNVYIRATSGSAPNIDWTVALEFLRANKFFKKNVQESRYIDVPMPKARNKISPNGVKVLAQIIPPGTQDSVPTLDRRDFNMAFCPDNLTTQRYNIDIVVTALDSRSAMATYVCVPPFKPPCTPTIARYTDPRGIGINVVTLQTGSGTVKDVYVVVVGWGDGEQMNNFVIGATIRKY